MSVWFRVKAWLKYKRNAKNRHGVHSPFVYALNEKVFPPQPAHNFNGHAAEAWRTLCLNNHDTIEISDFGTGNSGPRVVADIARKAAKSPRAAQFLHRLVAHFSPATMLELGTSLGITTLYQQSAAPVAKFITIEGCPQTAALAQSVFTSQNLHIELRTGTFENELLPALHTLKRVDYVYFDGNHRRQPTLDYFQTCLPFAHENSVFVFDDIHWSADMEAAWEEIKAHPQVTVTIDVFDFGLVFFRKGQVKEDFVIGW
ncbi:MAG: class I SAM-dependent methyltransferase [Bacteroidia bacterium]|jgi:predicted O-methyltransferase YrrM|nr:class I SAM-dependent methyltransferase [Bacteroidia bacterium]